jgi:hypothetical protein
MQLNSMMKETMFFLIIPFFLKIVLHHQIWIGFVNEVYVHYARQKSI